MARTRKMNANTTDPNMTKARLVEQIVALMHEGDGSTIETNVLLPSLSDPDDPREIDVLITGNIAGYERRIAVECKNHASRVTVGQIDEYAGKLQDAGLAVRGSLYVCVSGYGRQARRRAKDLGITIFQLEGLTSDRLRSAIYQAFQSRVYLLPIIENVTFTSERDSDAMWSVMFMTDRLGNVQGGLPDIVWRMWQKGEIKAELGTIEFLIKPPVGWKWHIDDPKRPRKVKVTLKIIGIVLTATGEANQHILNDIVESKLTRAHIRAIFTDDPESIELTVVETDEELKSATLPGGVADIVFESEKTPRIQILRKIYWPPTQHAIAAIVPYIEKMRASGNFDTTEMEKLTFEELEGTDIGAIWGETWEGHPSSRGEDWPMKIRESGSPSKRALRDINGKKVRINPKKKTPHK